MNQDKGAEFREEYILDIEKKLMSKYRVGYSGLHKLLVVKEGNQQFGQVFLWVLLRPIRSGWRHLSRSSINSYVQVRSSGNIRIQRSCLWIWSFVRCSRLWNKNEWVPVRQQSLALGQEKISQIIFWHHRIDRQTCCGNLLHEHLKLIADTLENPCFDLRYWSTDELQVNFRIWSILQINCSRRTLSSSTPQFRIGNDYAEPTDEWWIWVVEGVFNDKFGL